MSAKSCVPPCFRLTIARDTDRNPDPTRVYVAQTVLSDLGIVKTLYYRWQTMATLDRLPLNLSLFVPFP